MRKRCARILGSSAEADDICHEAFVKLMTSDRPPKRETECLSWLYRVSVNLSINHLNKRKNRHRLLDLQRDQVRPGASTAWDSSLLEDRTTCQALLDLVDDTTRATVICRYLLGMTQSEIADVVGGTRPTIKKRLERFVAAARQHLAAQEAT